MGEVDFFAPEFDVFEIGETLDSFREYVLVEQDFCKVETYFREEPGLWRETAYTNLTDMVVLKSLGISVAVGDVYEN